MKKLAVAIMICFMSTNILLGAALKKSAATTSLGDGGIDDSSSTSVLKVDSSNSSSSQSSDKDDESSGLATLPNGKAYVGVFSYLSLRDGVWGKVLATLDNNDEVTITGRSGDWYKVSSKAGSGYAHARYIFASPNSRYSGNDVSRTSDVTINVSGDSVQGKVVNAAKQLVNKYSTSGSFPYDPATNGGSLGCAQVVTTALKAAGVLPSIDLACLSVKSKLKNVGWQVVKAPPYQAGDVIFWSTYDRTGDGVKDADTHIGIVMASGNSVQAMSNSSSQKKPRYHDAEYAPVTTVMRKC